MADKFTKIALTRFDDEMVERHRSMFGMTIPEMVSYIRDNLAFYNGDDLMLAMSMLSDTQEMIERGMTEDARQLINRVKWLLGEVRAGSRAEPPPPPPPPSGYHVVAIRDGDEPGPVYEADGETLEWPTSAEAEAAAERLNALRLPNVTYVAAPVGIDAYDLLAHAHLKGAGWL